MRVALLAETTGSVAPAANHNDQIAFIEATAFGNEVVNPVDLTGDLVAWS